MEEMVEKVDPVEVETNETNDLAEELSTLAEEKSEKNTEKNTAPWEEAASNDHSDEGSNSAESSDEPNPSGVDEASMPFVGKWHTLNSTTNWEKGRIISSWREAKKEAGEEVSAFSDEAWAQLVGEVTSQHVGRLRRVFDRFGKNFTDYASLYWSHFHVSLDWEDAEPWLEGAQGQGWSVAGMRRQRDEAHGKSGEGQVIESRIAGSDLETVGDGELATVANPDADEEASADWTGSEGGSSDSSDRSAESDDETASSDEELNMQAAGKTMPKVRPFEEIADLPDDLADAFEAMKLAILHHKISGWEKISEEEVVSSLIALQQLTVAPSE